MKDYRVRLNFINSNIKFKAFEREYAAVADAAVVVATAAAVRIT